MLIDCRPQRVSVVLCCVQATQAYLAGNKALAKELSARGKEHAERMWSAHEAALEGILEARGAVSRVPGGGWWRPQGSACSHTCPEAM